MYFSSILLAEPFLKTFPLGITLNKPVVSVVPSELTHKMMQLHVVVNYYMHMDNKFFVLFFLPLTTGKKQWFPSSMAAKAKARAWHLTQGCFRGLFQ